jgi:hypothetical protein
MKEFKATHQTPTCHRRLLDVRQLVNHWKEVIALCPADGRLIDKTLNYEHLRFVTAFSPLHRIDYFVKFGNFEF